MTICLQGGGEFDSGCREMDKAMLRRISGGRMVVLPVGEPPGAAYDRVGESARSWFGSLGVAEVGVAADPRSSPDAARSAVATVSRAEAVVLAGSSVATMLAALNETGLAEAIRAAESTGTLVVGAGAGAMVLCEWAPRDPAGTGVTAGLGLLPATAALPGYSSGLRPGWLADVPQGVLVLGLRECSGVVVADDLVTSVGAGRTSLISGTDTIAVLDPDTTRDVWWQEAPVQPA